MYDYETIWDINLRANLRLWRSPPWNIARLTACFGQTYDEEAFLDAMRRADAAKAPGDTLLSTKYLRSTRVCGSGISHGRERRPSPPNLSRNGRSFIRP